MENAILVQDFINQVWNDKAFDKLESLLHADFKDQSLPAMLPNGKEGTKKWIINTNLAFQHNTVIEDQVTEGDNSIIKIRMNLKHIGVWRDIEPTGIDLHTTGYRHFRFKDGKIIEHWALIDGQTIESKLKEASRGCKIAR